MTFILIENSRSCLNYSKKSLKMNEKQMTFFFDRQFIQDQGRTMTRREKLSKFHFRIDMSSGKLRRERWGLMKIKKKRERAFHR